MPGSYSHICLHIVYCTKNRQRWLKGQAGEEMHSYLAGIINHNGSTALKVGGIDDHVHILCLLPKDTSLGEFIAKVKANSSKWFRHKHNEHFQWQDGYGAFSVSKSLIPKVSDYIANQAGHHLHTSSLAEFDALLKKHEIQIT